jgi:geranylgeranyl diphosphate synthase, type I
MGSDVAILAGDLALVLADDLFASSGFKDDAFERGLGAYSRMRQEVIAGQFLDVTNAARSEIDESEAARVAMLKSGRYSIVEPVLIGASLGGAADEMLDGLERFAAPLGEAFQLRDDLIGTFGDPAATGKSVESDIRQGKKHVLFAKALAKLEDSDRAHLLKLWGEPEIDERGVAAVRKLIESSGARAACEELIARLLTQSLEELTQLDVPEDARAGLADLARRAVERVA